MGSASEADTVQIDSADMDFELTMEDDTLSVVRR